MSWIDTWERDEGSEKWTEIWDMFETNEMVQSTLKENTVPAIYHIMSLNPEACLGVWKLHKPITFGGGSLGDRREQIISTAVSSVNECEY